MATGQRQAYQFVGKLRILGQERAVYVGAEDVEHTCPFGAVLTVVAESCDDAAQRLRVAVEIRPSAVVLESHDGAALPLHNDVPDAPRHVRTRVNRVSIEDADPDQIRADGRMIV